MSVRYGILEWVKTLVSASLVLAAVVDLVVVAAFFTAATKLLGLRPSRIYGSAAPAKRRMAKHPARARVVWAGFIGIESIAICLMVATLLYLTACGIGLVVE